MSEKSETLKQKQLELITRMKNGESGLILELWNSIEPLTMKFISRYLPLIEGNGTGRFDIDDLKQECFPALLDAVDYFDPQSGNFPQCYLWAIKSHTKYLRKGGALVSLDQSLIESDSASDMHDILSDPTAEGTAETAEQKAYTAELRKVINAIADEQLSPRQRDILRLRFEEQLNNRQAAKRLNVTETIAANELKRTLKIFRQFKNRRRLAPFLTEEHNEDDY